MVVMNKKYVGVIVGVDENGSKTPQIIIYNDKKFVVDRVLNRKRCVSFKVGGVGERYTISIGGQETYIFLEGDRWFVEEK